MGQEVLLLAAHSNTMKIAIFSDPHLGYARFETDSYVQAEKAIISASEKADLILCAGDIFDMKIPKLETLKRAVEIFNKAKIPLYAIHGNHERRPKDLVNPVQLLAASTEMKLLHGESAVFEKGGRKIQILGIGSVPEEYATEAVKRSMERFKKEPGAFSVLMIHQTIKELVPGGEDELSLDYLETLPFDLIVNGHIHETGVKLSGKFIMPGSTVITQLKEDETKGKGYFLYDTEARKSEFVEIGSRPFFYETLKFDGVGEPEIREGVLKRINEIKKSHPEAIIAIKIEGALKDGLPCPDIKFDAYPGVFIENRISSDSLGAKLTKIRESREASMSAKELALKELNGKTAGKITMFDGSELFEKLVSGADETLAYLEKQYKKDNK
jgi:DNA repair exonuclease SbcCD nuclease subunit